MKATIRVSAPFDFLKYENHVPKRLQHFKRPWTEAEWGEVEESMTVAWKKCGSAMGWVDVNTLPPEHRRKRSH